MMDLRNLYEEVILDHNRNPRNYPKRPASTNRSAHGFNPLCGDDFHLHLQVKDGIIEDVGFEGAGCAISTASASLMTEAIKGKDEAHAKQLFEQVQHLLTQSPETATPGPGLGKLSVLGGVIDYPMRVKCASLAWHTLQAALEQLDTPVSTE